MATGIRKRLRLPHPDVTVLHGVPFKVYARMTELDANRHLRMAYHDGVLEIVSPRSFPLHEKPSSRLRLIVTAVADALGLGYQGTDSSNFRLAGPGPGPYKGHGKEPDKSFIFTNVKRLPMDRDLNLNVGDPPPDLWIEVDNRVSSIAKLPIYAALGVPEVWRYRARRKKLIFSERVDGSYQPMDRSLCLPVLTPPQVLEALALGENLIESDWMALLRAWVARSFGPQAWTPRSIVDLAVA